MKTLRTLPLLALVASLAACTVGNDAGNKSHGTVSGRLRDPGAPFQSGNPSTSATPTPAPNAGPSSQPATGVEGSLITVWHVEADGSLTQLDGSTTTDVSGNYSLDVAFAGDAISDLVVKAESSTSGSSSGEAMISASLANGGQVSAPPMDSETKVEADVTIEMHVDGSWNAHDTIAGVASQIDTTVAAAVAAGAAYAADVQSLAATVSAGLDARAEMLTSVAVGGSQSQLDAWFQAEAQAKAQLDAALDLAATQNDVNAALTAYQQSIATALTTAGVQASQLAQSVRAQVTAEASASASLSTAAAAALQTQLAHAEADAIAKANEASLTALGAAAGVMTDAASAKATLDAAITASAGSTSSIDSAFASYDASITADLKTAAEAAVTGGSAAIDTVQGNLTTALAQLQTALSTAAGNAQSIVAAYSAFDASGETSVSGNATLGGLTTAEVQAVANALISIDG